MNHYEPFTPMLNPHPNPLPHGEGLQLPFALREKGPGVEGRSIDAPPSSIYMARCNMRAKYP